MIKNIVHHKHSHCNSIQNITIDKDNLYDNSLKTYIEEIKCNILSKKNIINSIRSAHLDESVGISDTIQIKKYLLSNLLDEFEYTISSTLKMIQIFNAEINKFKNPKSKINLKTSPKMYLPKQTISIENNNQFINNFFKKKFKFLIKNEANKDNSIYNMYNPIFKNRKDLSQNEFDNYVKTETSNNINKIKSSVLNTSNTNRVFKTNNLSIESNRVRGFYTNKSCSNIKDYYNLKRTENQNQSYKSKISNKKIINDFSSLNLKKDVSKRYINGTKSNIQKINNENLKQSKTKMVQKSIHKIPKTIREKLREKSESIKKNNKNKKEDNFQNEELEELIQKINSNDKTKNFIVQKYGKGDYNLFLWKLKFGKINKDNIEKDIILFNQISVRNKKPPNYCNNDFLTHSKIDNISYENFNKNGNNFSNNSNYIKNYS